MDIGCACAIDELDLAPLPQFDNDGD